MFNFPLTKKLATTQDRQILQNSDEKQDCQFWILRLVVIIKFPANRDCLLKLYMLIKSARTVSRELHWGKRVYTGLTSSSGHRLIWWGGCDIDLQLTQCFTGTYCVNQPLSHTCVYEETSLSLV